MERVELSSLPWEGNIIAVIRHPPKTVKRCACLEIMLAQILPKNKGARSDFARRRSRASLLRGLEVEVGVGDGDVVAGENFGDGAEGIAANLGAKGG